MGWWFRDRAQSLLASMAAVLLWPVTWYVSAWWGQYESIYVLPAVLAVLAARADRPGLVAVLVTAEPDDQAAGGAVPGPVRCPYLATQGLLGTRSVLIAAVTAFVLWLLALAAGGPLDYLANVQTYQNDIFSVLCSAPGTRGGPSQVVRAWRVRARWDAGPRPLTFRHLGLVLAGVLSLVVFVLVYRAPTARRSRWGSRPSRWSRSSASRRCTSATPSGLRVPADGATPLVAVWVALRVRGRSRPISWSRCRRSS